MAPVAVDLGALQAWLEERLGPVTAVEPLGAGAWSRAVAVTTADGRELVARCGPHVDDFEADAEAAAFASPDLPVPRTLLVAPGPGGHVSVTTRSHGVFLEDLDDVGWRRVWPALAAALRSLWRVPVTTLSPAAAARFGAGRSWPSFLLAVDADPEGGRLQGARARLAAHPAAEATFRSGLAQLRELAGSAPVRAVDDDPRLVHADLINRNVLVRRDRLDGVFDWGCVIVGDPLYDLAWLDVWSPWHPGLAALDVRAAAADLVGALGLDDDDADVRWQACALHILLGHLVYNAGTGDDDALEQVRRRTVQLG